MAELPEYTVVSLIGATGYYRQAVSGCEARWTAYVRRGDLPYTHEIIGYNTMTDSCRYGIKIQKAAQLGFEYECYSKNEF